VPPQAQVTVVFPTLQQQPIKPYICPADATVVNQMSNTQANASTTFP
jgi:hypothetical protein